MMLLKGCPRCQRGDLVVDREVYGFVVSCLQCGYAGDLSTAYWRFIKPESKAGAVGVAKASAA